jgi:hypothetical protein
MCQINDINFAEIKPRSCATAVSAFIAARVSPRHTYILALLERFKVKAKLTPMDLEEASSHPAKEREQHQPPYPQPSVLGLMKPSADSERPTAYTVPHTKISTEI